MENFKSTFGKDACLAGVVMGLAVFVIYLLSCFFKWELNDHGFYEGILVLVVLIAGAFLFGSRRAAKAGALGMSYGQSLGFLCVAMVIAGAVAAVGALLLQKVIAPDYYAQVVEHALTQAEEIMAINPMLAGNSDQMEAGMELGRKMASSAFAIFFGALFNVAFIGILVSLFVSIFVKRPAEA